jgi:hypothetical protein
MKKAVFKPFDVVACADLPEMSVNPIPAESDPIEIKGE